MIFVMLLLSFSVKAKDFELLKNGLAIAKLNLISKDSALVYAKNDFLSDLQKITGNKVSQTLASKVFIAKVADIDFVNDVVFKNLTNLKGNLTGKWESYQVFTKDGNLYIIGSDLRGTMWGMYHFMEKYLGVDPMYLWTGKTPTHQSNLVFDKIAINTAEPSFKFRGWFINDEDYLKGWKQFKGGMEDDSHNSRSTVITPEVSKMIIETMLRLRMNLIIPSSYNDILNPDEEIAVNEAAKRGLFISQHHIAPLGVSAYSFDDYFTKQGKEIPLYSYYSNPKKMEEVWETYVKAWTKYPDVVWQLGLRGRGDQAMWVMDPAIPKNDSIRGKIITDAVMAQYHLVKKYNPNAFTTFTLWWEVARLMKQGYIKANELPDDLTIVFADNSPGWGISPDFYTTERKANKHYGLYYHQQLWNTGPHFVQAIPPSKTYEVLNEAYQQQTNYCIFNVGNIREFTLGLKAGANMLFDMKAFPNSSPIQDFCNGYYGKWAKKASSIYQAFFDHYLLDKNDSFRTGFTEMPNSPYILDGNLAIRMEAMLDDFNHVLDLHLFKSASWNVKKAYVSLTLESMPRFREPDGKVITWAKEHAIYLAEIEKQKQNLAKVIDSATKLHQEMEGQAKEIFNVNLLAPAKMFYELMDCTAEVMEAMKAESTKDRKTAVVHLKKALSSIQKTNKIKQEVMMQGKWKNWYRNESNVKLEGYEQYLKYLTKNN